jgi:molybdopterin-guanine dinucleotide biosynthesis protein A
VKGGPAAAPASVVGFAVAGGESLRMGRDKALLPWGDADLLDHALARLRAVAADVRILCGAERRYLERGLPVEPDVARGVGPLAGVLTGLTAAPGRPGLFLAVDLPHVPVALLERLVERSEGWDAVVPLSPRGAEPLCAVYGPGCREPIRARIAAGDFKMTAFWPEVRVRRVEPAELGEFGDPMEMFQNLNTPEDLATQ